MGFRIGGSGQSGGRPLSRRVSVNSGKRNQRFQNSGEGPLEIKGTSVKLHNRSKPTPNKSSLLPKNKSSKKPQSALDLLKQADMNDQRPTSMLELIARENQSQADLQRGKDFLKGITGGDAGVSDEEAKKRASDFLPPSDKTQGGN